MAPKKLKRKLSLTKKTIANLNASDLKEIQGGTMTQLPEATCYYQTCTCVMPCFWP
jgi:hypothetical protein